MQTHAAEPPPGSAVVDQPAALTVQEVQRSLGAGRRHSGCRVGLQLCEGNRVAGPVEDALELSHRFAARSPDAVRAAKQLLNASALISLQEGLANEFDASAGLMGKKNQIEAVIAKLEGRAPHFQDPSSG